MVLQKRLDYGSSGYQVPAMPHVPRSAKGKRSVRKKAEDNQMCAFDLLATVAGKMLERENYVDPFSTAGTSSSSPSKGSIQQEQLDKGHPNEAQVFDDTSSNKSALGSGSVFHRQINHITKEFSSQVPKTGSSHSLAFIKPNTSESEAFGGKFLFNGRGGDVGHSLGTIPEKCGYESHSPGSMESCKYKSDDEFKKKLQTERVAGNAMDGIATGMCSLEDQMDTDTKPPALLSLDSSVEVPLCGDRIVSNSSFPKCGDAMELPVDRDDDENSSGCTHPRTTTNKACRPQRIGDRRIRKLLASKYWKVAPPMLKDGELSETEMKPVPRNRKLCYTRQRTQRDSCKRQKLFEHCRISASDGAICSEGTSKSPLKGHIKVEANESDAASNGANGASSATGQKSSYGSEDYHVKFSVKSFKVPELFIEIPKNATVGLLKRTVMEAVTAMLGGGLRVGVLHQGKKVRDDSKTLLQTGISRSDQLDNLGFTLEPNPKQALLPLTIPKETQLLPPSDATETLTRIPAVASPSDQGASSATLQPPLTAVGNCPESDHDSVHSPADVSSLDNPTTNCKALVPVPTMSVDALAVVPLRKSRRSDLVQRRIRRPFSVTEVEALVQAVEKLGTGRWRDVKLRAFDNAKHRTYVDLKDKWKTLVHTARISPQQRRGEPVPQELLDRVLAAHAYWSQQQAKLQAKAPPAEACLLI